MPVEFTTFYFILLNFFCRSIKVSDKLLFFSVSVYGSGSLIPNMHVPVAAARGPFNPSQWIELEHQALIYKYITSNVPVPSHLLVPIKKALHPYGMSAISAGSSLPHNSSKLVQMHNWWVCIYFYLPFFFFLILDILPSKIE